ncbi:MAG: adenylate/guanylate cyclase domain-containing protein [Pseudomonadota bacterium]
MWTFPLQSAGKGIVTQVLSLKPLHARVLLLGLSAIVTLSICLVFKSGLATFEERVGTFGWQLNSDTTLEERINIVAIDEKSIQQIGAWPWSRDTFARLTESLSQAGVQMQLYDVAFPEAKEGDDNFVAALQNSQAVLSQALALQTNQAVQTGTLTHGVSGISCTSEMNTAQSFIAPAAIFSDVAKGHITPLVDNDGAIRKVPAFICVDGSAYPALSVSALLMATTSEPWAASVSEGDSGLSAEKILRLDAYPGLEVPLDNAGNMRISFRKAPEAFRVFSAIDILNGAIDPDLLENTWVLIGATAFGMGDIVPTPFSGAAPGVEIQARLLSSLLDNAVPYTPRAATVLLMLVSAAFAGLLLLIASGREKFADYGLPACALILPSFAILLHAQLLTTTNLWLGWISPALYSLSSVSLLVLYGYARVRMERGRVLSNLSSYLPTDVAQEIAYTLPNSSINAKRQNATLLNADLRNFSAYGEARPPEESAALLHYFFVKSTEIIEKHKGRVHEFKGDSLLAIWDGGDSVVAALALQAAKEMKREIQDVLPQNPPLGLEPLALGIGIEQGPVLIGSIGPAHRRSHTLLGETVTITLRIQDMTAELAQPILIGECAARQLGDQKLQSQGSYLLSGLRIPHTLFAPPLQDILEPKTRNDQPTLKLLHGGRQ